MKARISEIVLVAVGAMGLLLASPAHGQLQQEETPEAAEVTVTLGTLSEPFEMEVYEEAPAELALPEGDVTVKYWGDGDAIVQLQDIAWSIDVNDPAHTSLPLGIAPLSDQTVPTMSLGAVAIMLSTNGAVVTSGRRNRPARNPNRGPREQYPCATGLRVRARVCGVAGL